MKHYLTFFLIAVMSLGLVFLLVTRPRTAHDAPAEVIELKTALGDAGADAGSLSDAASPVDASVNVADAAPAVQPLRVTTLGWELAAPAATLKSDAAIETAPESEPSALEARLARGGGDPQGADIAVMPLPSFITSYDRLRALEPRAFLVVGWSRGREEVHANAGALLKPPPGADEVKIASGGTDAANVLALFGVDLLGVASSRTRLVTAEADVKAAAFAGVVKGTADARKLAFSTADASRLVPIIAIAPKSVLDARAKDIDAWAKAWLAGLNDVANDVPGVSRKLAGKNGVALLAGVGGAPEALVLVERLGLIEKVGLEQQTATFGPLAKSPVTLESLMTRMWSLERGGGLTTSTAPDPAPIDARVITDIAPPPAASTPEPAAEGDAGAAFGPLPSGAVPLAMYRATDGDQEKAATQIAFLAGVFPRAFFKVQAKGGEKAAKAIAGLARDKGVVASRLGTMAGDPPGALAAVEVLSPP